MRRLISGMVAVILLCMLGGCAEMCQTTKVSSSPVLDRILAGGELRVGVSGDMPPLNMTDSNQKIIGMDADLSARIADLMGVSLKLQQIPFADLMPALESGKIDMIVSNMTMTADRNLKAAFVGPYFNSGKAFLTKRSSIAQARNLPDIDSPQFTFAALKQSTSEALIRDNAPNAKLVTTDSQNEAIQMVIDGKADAMIADYPICIVAIARNPSAGLLSVITPITYEPIGIAIPKGDPLMVNWLDNVLMNLDHIGYLDALKEKWFTQADWLKKMK